MAAQAQALGLDGWAMLTAQDPDERLLRIALARATAEEIARMNRRARG